MSDQSDFQTDSQERLDAWRSEIRTFCDLARGEVDRIQSDLTEAERLAAEQRAVKDPPVNATPTSIEAKPTTSKPVPSTYRAPMSNASTGSARPESTLRSESRPASGTTPSHDASLDRLANLKRQLAEKLSHANQADESEADDYS